MIFILRLTRHTVAKSHQLVRFPSPHIKMVRLCIRLRVFMIVRNFRGCGSYFEIYETWKVFNVLRFCFHGTFTLNVCLFGILARITTSIANFPCKVSRHFLLVKIVTKKLSMKPFFYITQTTHFCFFLLRWRNIIGFDRMCSLSKKEAYEKRREKPEAFKRAEGS